MRREPTGKVHGCTVVDRDARHGIGKAPISIDPPLAKPLRPIKAEPINGGM